MCTRTYERNKKNLIRWQHTADIHLILLQIFDISLLGCQPSCFIQVFVPHLTLKPLQIHKHLTEVLTIKLRTEKRMMTWSKSWRGGFKKCKCLPRLLVIRQTKTHLNDRWEQGLRFWPMLVAYKCRTKCQKIPRSEDARIIWTANQSEPVEIMSTDYQYAYK